MARYLGYAWGSVNTLIGLFYVLPLVLLKWYSYSHAMKTPKGAKAFVVLVNFNKAPKWLCKLWSGDWYGHTFGNIIVLRSLNDIKQPVHESVHVDQFMKFGPVFLPLYGLTIACAHLVGERGYFMCPFEIAARRYAGQTVDVKPIKNKKR